MSYNDIIFEKLYVGDYETAQNLSLLQELNITHIVACGFSQGHFPK
jgi:hypothetical protein